MATATVTVIHPETFTAAGGHEPDHGFCVVCGGVWPCWRAVRHAS